jgi:uncharacterized membrane protein YcaP (DUF421 family)
LLSQLGDALLPHWSYDRFVALFIISVKTTLIYIFLILGLRFGGKREMGEMNVYDMILIVVLGNAVQNAMVGHDDTVAGGLVSATTLLVLNYAVATLIERSPRFERLLSGGPVVIVRDGRKREAVMKREGVTHDELMTALRSRGLDRLEDARKAVLEVSGEISIIPRKKSNVAMERTHRAFKGLNRQ